MQVRRCITSAVALALSSALPAIASPLAATTSATTPTSAAQSAASNTASFQARSQAVGRTPIEQDMIRQHGLRQFGHEQASVNSNGRFAVDRDFGRDRAEDRHDLNDARRMQRTGRWARDRDDVATYRHDDDRFSGRWHNYARHDRDHDRRASRDVNSNGRFALDRDFGRDRAADRHALNDTRHTDRTASVVASTSAATQSTTQSNRWQTADRDYAMERAVERSHAAAQAAQAGAPSGDRFDWDDNVASRAGDRATPLATTTRQPEHATPHFVNVMGGAVEK